MITVRIPNKLPELEILDTVQMKQHVKPAASGGSGFSRLRDWGIGVKDFG